MSVFVVMVGDQEAARGQFDTDAPHGWTMSYPCSDSGVFVIDGPFVTHVVGTFGNPRAPSIFDDPSLTLEHLGLMEKHLRDAYFPSDDVSVVWEF